MPKTKISEYSATANSNTDVASINIDEGCAPSGINNAIRAIMGHLKDFQSGTSNDPFTIGSSGSLTLSYGTANGVAYLNGSKVLTTGSALVFDGTNLGVGTSSPASRIQAYAGTGVGASHATLGASATGYWNFNSGGGSSDRVIARGYNSTGTEIIRFDPAGDSFINGGNLGLGVTPSAWSGLGGIETMYKATGYFAHKSFPNTYTVGNAYYNGSNWIYGTTGYSAAYYGVVGQTGAHQWFTAPSGTAGNTITFTQAMTLDASGNLGVGNTSPGSFARLTVQDSGSGAGTLALISSAASNAIYIKNTGTSADFKYNDAYPMTWSINGTERMRLDSSGNLLVGTTSTNVANNTITGFGLDGKALTASYGVGINSTSATGTQYFVVFGRNSSACGTISSTATNSTTYATSSDYRLKENIATMTGALATVAQLNPVTYTWKEDGTAGQGFIAHELQAIVPDAVVGEKDAVNEDGSIKPQGIDTSYLVATLTAAIQELKAEFDAYKASHP